METPHEDASGLVAGHYDQLDPFYRRLWGEHLHHGLWTDPALSTEEAVLHLVHQVAKEARLEPGSQVCDIGCGYGAPARLWAEQYGADVIGFTVSEAQQAYAQVQPVDGPAPEYRLQDFLDNDLPDESVDAVVAIESLSHIEDQPRVLWHASRILRPGGRLVACVWMAPPAPAPWMKTYLLEPIRREGRLAGLPTATDLFRWTTATGLTVERLDDVTSMVRRTWSVVLGRLIGALVQDPTLWTTLFDRSVPDRIFARTLPRIWLAQHLGALRYGWLVARK